MEILSGLIDWFADPSHWTGADGIPHRISEHLQLSLLSLGVASAVAVPVGLLVGHTGRGQFLVSSLTNMGRAIPSFAIIGLVVPFSLRMGFGMGFWPTILALIFLSIPPIVTNSYVGIHEIDRDTLEAARGMGMSTGQVLTEIELPLAAPLIVVGLRTAFVQVIATATLAALVAGGGLGRYIIHGFAVRDFVEITGGAILVAVLAIAAELAFGVVERWITPRGIRPETKKRFRPAAGVGFSS